MRINQHALHASVITTLNCNTGSSMVSQQRRALKMSVSPHKSASPGFRRTARLMFVTQSVAKSLVGDCDKNLGFQSVESRTKQEKKLILNF